MAMQKRMFIRDGVDLKEFAKTAKASKEFTLERQNELVKFVMDSKLDKVMISGVKNRRIRKKRLKKEMTYMKEYLTFRMLDMMEFKWVDVPEDVTDEDDRAFEALERMIAREE